MYVGITNNPERRFDEHLQDGREFTPKEIDAESLTRGQARAIEESIIVDFGLQRDGGRLENQRHELAVSRDIHGAAVEWGRWWRRQNG